MHERSYLCSNRVARFGVGVDAWQDWAKAAIADQPVDGADQLGVIASNDYALGGKQVLNVMLQSPHT